MNQTTIPPDTTRISIILEGAGGILIDEIILIIGNPPEVIPDGPPPIIISYETMANILTIWRAHGGTQNGRPSEEAAAIIDLCPAFLPVAIPSKS